MSEYVVGEAFSAGIGLVLGLAMAQSVFETMETKKTVERVIICLKCGYENNSKNKFCTHCGQAFYPEPSTQCFRCSANMSPNLDFCRRCGSSQK